MNELVDVLHQSCTSKEEYGQPAASELSYEAALETRRAEARGRKGRKGKGGLTRSQLDTQRLPCSQHRVSNGNS